MRGALLALTIATATLATGAVGAGAVVASRSGSALPGVSVAGSPVGGQNRAQLTFTVEGLAERRGTGTLSVVADDVSATVDRSLVSIDVQGTVDDALARGRSGSPLAPVLGPLLERGDRTVALRLATDRSGVRQRVDALADQVDRTVDQGGLRVTVQAGKATAVPVLAVPGRRLDRAEAVQRIDAALRTGAPGPVELPAEVTEPAATDTQLQAIAATATAVLASPFTLTAGPTSMRLDPVELAPLLSAGTGAGGPVLQVDRAGLTTLVTAKAKPLATPPTSAGFDVEGRAATLDNKGDLTWTPKPAQISARPAVDGRAVDVEATMQRLTRLVLSNTHAAGLPVKPVEPVVSTAQVKAAGVRTLMGAFTTYYKAGQPRASNIRRIAQIVDGTYVPAGGTFSLNGTAGKRTEARGFVADGAIVDGKLTDEVGGGVSQFATTLFNAAFFAGLPIPEHKPHSFYISRYPAGRESTVYFGALDVKVVNDTANGMLIRTRSTASSVTVELYGDNGGRRVSSTAGPRQALPSGGFRIQVTRVVAGGDGRSSRRVFSTTYDPVSPEDGGPPAPAGR